MSSALLFLATVRALQVIPSDASHLVRDWGPAVVAVEVIEVNSSAKAASGSGFFVSERGHVLTNYHVVAQAVLEPARHTIHYIERNGEPAIAEVIAVDVVNDLALLATDHTPTSVLSLSDTPPVQGTRFYAFGFPGDLGLAVVDGTYNGYLEHTFTDRMHFTGTLHPGMSGGPVLSDAGVVIGINVATAGDVSFLIPAIAGMELTAIAAQREFRPPTTFVGSIGDQLIAFQEYYVNTVLESESVTVSLDRYQVPSQPAPFFDCWGDTFIEDDNRWEFIDHRCHVDDVMFISDEYRPETLQIFHRVVRSESINRFRFHRLLTESFRANSFWTGGNRKDVTPFECHNDNIDVDGRVLITIFCARRLQRFEGLFDVVFKIAAIASPRSGLESTLQLSAISFENATRIAQRYVRLISWTP